MNSSDPSLNTWPYEQRRDATERRLKDEVVQEAKAFLNGAKTGLTLMTHNMDFCDTEPERHLLALVLTSSSELPKQWAQQHLVTESVIEDEMKRNDGYQAEETR